MTFNPSNPTKEDDIKMMHDPTLWPQYPILPIKKRSTDGKMGPTAVLIHANDTTKLIDDVNMWALPPADDLIKMFQEAPVAEPEKLSAEGWVVD